VKNASSAQNPSVAIAASGAGMPPNWLKLT